MSFIDTKMMSRAQSATWDWISTKDECNTK